VGRYVKEVKEASDTAVQLKPFSRELPTPGSEQLTLDEGNIIML